MTRRAVLLVLLLSACSPTPPQPGIPPRQHWKEQVAGLFACRSRSQVDAFLEGIRRLPPRRPASLGGGSVSFGGKTLVYDLFTLDETHDLFLVWNGQDPEQGVRSVEVVAFADLRPRIRPEHFDALQALHRCPSAAGYWSFDPVLVVRAVNAFLRLGGEARAALQAYGDLARSLPPEEGVKYGLDEGRLFPVIQLLGTRPSPFRLGDAGVVDPGPASWPLFPMVLEGDLPFIVVSGYELAGKPENPSGRLGPGFALRPSPLVPPIDPIQAVEALLSSPRWEALLAAGRTGLLAQDARKGERLKRLVRGQALEAIAPLYRPPDDVAPKSCCEDPSETAWRRVVDEVRGLGLTWDPVRQDFVRSR